MKKLFLITLIGGLALSASAQTTFNGPRDDHRSQNRNDHFNRDDHRIMDNRIAAINNEYDQKINQVKFDHRLRSAAKRRKVRQLERERTVALEQCRNSFSHPYAGRNHQ